MSCCCKALASMTTTLQIHTYIYICMFVWEWEPFALCLRSVAHNTNVDVDLAIVSACRLGSNGVGVAKYALLCNICFEFSWVLASRACQGIFENFSTRNCFRNLKCSHAQNGRYGRYAVGRVSSFAHIDTPLYYIFVAHTYTHIYARICRALPKPTLLHM